MKVHIIYPDIDTWVYSTVHHGIASIVAILRKHGYQVSLQHIKRKISKRSFLKTVRYENPDIICISSTTNQYPYVETFVKWLKEKYDIPIVVGGIHPTLAPEDVINNPYIDMICIGEGEYALLELCDNLVDGKPFEQIMNFWIKKNKNIIKNPLRDLLDINELPIPDYTIFNRKDICWKKRAINLIAGRGCFYNCTYCCNHALKELYAGKGSFVRLLKVDILLNHIENLVNMYDPSMLCFEDDIFIIKKDWLKEFCDRYRRKFNIPFVCNGRFDVMDEEMLEWLTSANCVRIHYGLESGNKKLRTNVLNRGGMTNERIKYVIQKTKEKNIKVMTYNIIGFPTETSQAIDDTIELNKATQPDHMAVFCYYPYPGTDLYKICKENGYLTNNHSSTYCEKSILNLTTISAKELRKKYSEFSALSMEAEIKSRYPYFSFMVKIMNKLLGGIITRRILTIVYRNT